MFDNPTAPTALHEFFMTHSDAILNAALLLGGPDWLRRTRQIFDRLSQPVPPTRLTLNEIRKLYNLLTLEYAHDPETDAAECFAMLDPGSSEIEQICLLTEALEEAAEKSGLVLGAWVPPATGYESVEMYR